MPNIVANTDFIGQILIPKDMGGVVDETLDALIAIYEPDFLRNALGNKVYALFDAGKATPGRWKDIVDGVSYVVNDNDITIPPIKTYIADYIYYWWMRNEATKTSNVSETVSSVENAVAVSNYRKMIRAFNESSTYLSEGLHCYEIPIYGGLWYMLLNRVDDSKNRIYPEFQLRNSNVRHFSPLNQFNI